MVRETIKYDNGIEVEISVEDGITKYAVRYGLDCNIYKSESFAIDYVKKLSDDIVKENICKEKDKEWLTNRVAGWKAATADNGLAIKEV